MHGHLDISGQLALNKLPVDQLVHEGLFVALTIVLIVQVVSMLPHIHGKQRNLAFLGEGGAGADGLGDLYDRHTESVRERARERER